VGGAGRGGPPRKEGIEKIVTVTVTSPPRRSAWAQALRNDGGLRVIAGLGLALYAVFIVLPLFMSLHSSLTNASPLNATSQFVGLANYRQMLHDDALHAAVIYTLVLAVGVTVVANAVGFGFAVLLNRTSLSYRVLRTLAFLPQVISGVITGFVWQTILTENGVLNTLLLHLHVIGQPIDWLGDPHLAQLSVGLVTAWVLSGFTTVVYLAALQSIPQELYDAASIDGAGPGRRLRSITVPMTAPATTICVTICLITVMKLYDIITVLTGGGPAFATQSAAQYIVQLAFTGDEFGYASAVAIGLLAISAVLALSVTHVLRRREVNL
jgi:ABC-type sugar transport system permease subunit